MHRGDRPYLLLTPRGVVESSHPGTLGGHRRSKIYGRLDCPGALLALSRGGPYAQHRVFFQNETDAIECGYRPCARCMPEPYRRWRALGGSALSHHKG